MHIEAAEWRRIRRRSSLAVVRSPLLTESKLKKAVRRSVQGPESDIESERLAEPAAEFKDDEDVRVDEDREAYIFDLKIFALSLKYQPARAVDSESDAEMDKYDVMYGIRQLKAGKRFQNWKNQVEKNAQAEQ